MERPLEHERVGRRLMAILAADVVGYSRLIGADDEGTLVQLKAHHDELVGPKIKEYRGRVVRTTGDGLLVLFASTVDCLRCAVEVQRGMAERNAQVPSAQRIEFRMGISVGDIIVQGRSVHGDGVNVAARLEALAEAGGICICERVKEDVRSKLDVAFEDAGERQLKNISRPVSVYRVRRGEIGTSVASAHPDHQYIGSVPAESWRSTRLPSHVNRKAHPAMSRWAADLRMMLAYSFTPIAVLLVVHYLVVIKLDINTAFLRIVTLLVPFTVGFLLFRKTGRGLGAAFLLGTFIGITSVAGMLAVVGLLDSTTVIPSSLFEWQEAIEYVMGIALAAVVGSAVARAVDVALLTSH